MRVQLIHQIDLDADINAAGEPDDRVTYTVKVDGELLGEIKYKLGKFTVELAANTHALDIAQSLRILSIAMSKFDATDTWSDIEFDLEVTE